MTFEEYQKESRKTAIYPNAGKNYLYPVLGLCGESGEVAERFKKLIRDSGGELDEEQLGLIKKELGDVLWYISQICSELDLSLDEVALHNIEKLMSRKKRGVLGGSGDTR